MSTDIKRLVRDFGQLFILAFDGPNLTFELIDFFKTFRIGGLILFSDNYQNPQKLKELITEIQESCTELGMPMLITTDHEGGKIQQFREGFTIVSPMAEYGAGPPEKTRQIHEQIGRELRDVGVNLNFSPVADLCATDAEGSIGNRSFGEEPGIVSTHVAAAISGLQTAGMLTCVKHFPGHGATKESSHQVLPVIDLDMDVVYNRELVPFQAAIQAGVDVVMPGHIVFSHSEDPQWPASLSSFWLSTVLREQMQWQGPIITDALEMKALINNWNPVECGVRALQAGVDILLYYREKNQFQAFYELRMALERRELDPAKIAQSLERVRLLKEKIRRT